MNASGSDGGLAASATKRPATSAPYYALEAHSLDYDANDSESGGLDDVLSLAEPLKQTQNLLPNGQAHPTSPKTSMQNFLQTVPHLFTLTPEQISSLDVMVREYSEMDLIIEEGAYLEHIYVLASGTVEVMNSKKGLKRAFGHRRIGSMVAPSVFGIDDAILESAVEFTYHASSSTTLLLIPRAQFMDLFARSPIFANNVSSQILRTLPSFSVFQEFCRAVFGISSSSVVDALGRKSGYRLALSTLVRLFRSSGTVLHRHANANEIDYEALRYCTRRLPTNITTTYIVILTQGIPDYLSDEFLADAANTQPGVAPLVAAVDTGKRRRCAWTFGGGGQTLVLMRDGFTDTVDFVSNLCIFCVEAKKLRTRLQQLVSPSAAEVLRNALAPADNAFPPQSRMEEVFASLPFSEEEAQGLQNVWGDATLHRLYDVVVHREEYVVEVESVSSKVFSEDPYANWALTILRHVKSRLGVSEMEALPENILIDVLFSPNRTLKNLFCCMSADVKMLIENISEETGIGKGERTGNWKNVDDRYYYVLTGLLERDATIRDAYRARLESNGFTLMEDGHASALIVDLIDVSSISPDETDPGLRECAAAASRNSKTGKRHFIINVDKTFGAQIEAILRSLLLTFGSRIRSVNLTGKAAGLSGNRGDVVLPQKLIFSKQTFGEDSTDEIRLCNRKSLRTEDIAPFLGKSCSAEVHHGTCITLPGFMLQSEAMLKFYREVHGCTAVDMQSSYVARQLEECRRTGVLRQTIASRYLFYCDDMPLGNVNGSVLKPQKREIISTIYATARALLCKILES
ncbi:Cyclic nucleotide-binding domain containing protein [Novymonas esmeraldas]|uniref:Cyclic nucleotide-binding domain containing protein n=1 Tax=Novymonas esmeraldas TaxID=1808958 RepID=A0AAW0EZT8_9TRYP